MEGGRERGRERVVGGIRREVERERGHKYRSNK